MFIRVFCFILLFKCAGKLGVVDGMTSLSTEASTASSTISLVSFAAGVYVCV